MIRPRYQPLAPGFFRAPQCPKCGKRPLSKRLGNSLTFVYDKKDYPVCCAYRGTISGSHEVA